MWWASKMAQWAEAPATNPSNMSVIPRAHTVEGSVLLYSF